MKSRKHIKASTRGDIEHDRFDQMVREKFSGKAKKRAKPEKPLYTTQTELVLEINWKDATYVIVCALAIMFIYHISPIAV